MKKKLLIIIPLMIFCALTLLSAKVEATYRSNDPTVTSGENITITVTSTEALENYDLSLKTHEGLTYVGCSASNAAVNSNNGKISYASFTKTTTLGTYTFKAPEVTKQTKYTVTFDINGTTNKSTVTVNPKATNNGSSGSSGNTGSSNNSGSNSNTATQPKKGTISSVSINGIKCKESVTVVNKESVPILVKTSTGEGATIYNSLTKKSYTVKSGVSKSVQILEGTNTITITLDTGYSETRKIYSQKEEVVEANQIEEEEEKEVNPLLNSLEIEGFTLTPEFSSETYEYTLTIPEEQADITKLNIEATANKEDFTVEITGNEELQEGENIIKIIVKSADGEKVATYKIIVFKELPTVETIAEVVDENQAEEINNTIDIRKVIIIAFTVIVAIAGIILAVIEFNYGKKLNEDNNEEIKFAKVGYEKEESIEENIENDNAEDVEKKKLEKDEVKKDNKKQGKDIETIYQKKKKGKHF